MPDYSDILGPAMADILADTLETCCDQLLLPDDPRSDDKMLSAVADAVDRVAVKRGRPLRATLILNLLDKTEPT